MLYENGLIWFYQSNLKVGKSLDKFRLYSERSAAQWQDMNLESPTCVTTALCKMFSKWRRFSFDLATMTVMPLAKFLFCLANILLATLGTGYLNLKYTESK